MIRTLARLKAGRTALIAPALALLASAASAMEPVRSDGMPLPQAKPDLALFYPAEPVEISLPVPRPDPQTILPRATRTVAEMYLQQTGTETGKDALYTLKNGEGLGKLLRRAGYEATDVAAAVDAVSGRASLRALPVGLDVRVTPGGFAFTTRNGRDIFAIDDPEEGWVAFSAIRPVERYLSFAQGVINDSIYRAAANSNIPDDALAEYVRIMGFSVDFQREIRSGDAFELLY